MQTYTDVENQQWNVVIVSEFPVGDEKKRHSEIANHQPMEWSRACQWVNGIMTGIGKDWKVTRFVDIYIEPVGCRRPMSQQIKAALDNNLSWNEPPHEVREIPAHQAEYAGIMKERERKFREDQRYIAEHGGEVSGGKGTAHAPTCADL